jgi:hypothetical protein
VLQGGVLSVPGVETLCYCVGDIHCMAPGLAAVTRRATPVLAACVRGAGLHGTPAQLLGMPSAPAAVMHERAHMMALVLAEGVVQAQCMTCIVLCCCWRQVPKRCSSRTPGSSSSRHGCGGLSK